VNDAKWEREDFRVVIILIPPGASAKGSLEVEQRCMCSQICMVKEASCTTWAYQYAVYLLSLHLNPESTGRTNFYSLTDIQPTT
jgi:hypothetical protein